MIGYGSENTVEISSASRMDYRRVYVVIRNTLLWGRFEFSGLAGRKNFGNIGMMERWNNGFKEVDQTYSAAEPLEIKRFFTPFPSFHGSIIPLFQQHLTGCR